MSSVTHWTERSIGDFLYSIATDFIEDLKEKMQTLGMTQSQLAKAANVHKSFVSRVFKDPGNLTLETIVKFARTVGMKVSIVPYEDPSDPDNHRGPISSDVFRWCWEHSDRPADMWAVNTIKQTVAVTGNAVDLATLITIFDLGGDAIGYSFESHPTAIQRKPFVTSGSLDVDLPNVIVRESKNTSRSSRIAA